MKMNNNILIFVTRYLCYASNEYFADKIAFELNRNGYNVELVNIIDSNTAETFLAKYIGKQYRAIIDFNSVMPRAMVNDKRFIDLIDGPFYNYIVDHPLYHHPILSIPLNDFNVICVDEYHKSYIEKHYPNIKKVICLPLAGSKSLTNLEYSKRKSGILFTGTYYDLEKYRLLINEKSDSDRKDILNMIEYLQSDIDNRPEMFAFEEKFSNLEDYAAKLNSLYLADIYVRAVNRKNAIDKFLAEGNKIIILGNEWDKYPNIDNENIMKLSGMDYINSLDVIASCKILLNILPGFRAGIHDRILTGMVNGTAVISDSNDYLDNHFTENEIITFNYNNIDNEVIRISQLINDEEYIYKLAENARQKAENEYTWDALVKKLLEFI